ncbi:hypothetical protein Goshw_020504 [Gossypium schwendimanii]|uniref:Uncharacterized protein n=1 Tax=Gossypium schwendimanii TaxID=34291 RepID=A0A7J9MD86_GOSSC|nr:hypothetical protein [Gossypium schwendimanii]
MCNEELFDKEPEEKFDYIDHLVEAMELRKVQEVKPIKTEEIYGICEIMGHSTFETNVA